MLLDAFAADVIDRLAKGEGIAAFRHLVFPTGVELLVGGHNGEMTGGGSVGFGWARQNVVNAMNAVFFDPIGVGHVDSMGCCGCRAMCDGQEALVLCWYI